MKSRRIYFRFISYCVAADMNVVCSGISTPTPSPRVQRRQYQGYSRSFLPSYMQGSTTPPVHHRTGSREHKHNQTNDSSLRDSIPAMRKPVAVTCLVLNILLPGLGKWFLYSRKPMLPILHPTNDAV